MAALQGIPIEHLTFVVQPQDVSAEEEDAYIDGIIQSAALVERPPTISFSDILDGAEEKQDLQLARLTQRDVTLKPSLRIVDLRPHY